MANITPPLPIIGNPNSTEDPKTLAALTAILAVINGGIDSTNITDASVAIGDIAGNVLVTPSGRNRSLRVFTNTQAVTNGGWQTVAFPFGFTLTSIDLALGIPNPNTNGSALQGFSLAGFTTSSISLFINSSLAQNVTLYGFTLGVV